MTEPSVLSLNLQQLLTEHSYLIPMYQRNYAWGKGEIQALIDDVLDACQKDAPYYIGTLVVFKRKDGTLEVIDGQQRLTTLTLLALCLDKNENSSCAQYLLDFKKPNIYFESRPQSRETLQLLFDGTQETDLKYESLNGAIIDGFEIIKEVLQQSFKINNKIKSSKITLNQFCIYLFEKVLIAQVPVPEETDLNHYFEVMNNRGEQLEKHEIIKARLLSIIEKANEDDIKTADKKLAKVLIHDVWEACANMNKYVQYGFKTSLRTAIFSEEYNDFTAIIFKDLLDHYKKNAEDEELKQNNLDQKVANLIIDDTPNPSLTLHKILFDKTTVIPPNPKDKNKNKDDDSEIYYSLVNFPNFLLHVLKIMLNTDGELVDISLDDKQLLPQFEKYIIGKDVVQPYEQTTKFIYALLKTKFLFDKYVIKRKPLDDKHWSLEKLEKRGKDRPLDFYNSFEDEKTNKKLIMLQSVFHVSAPTMNYKHWLNASLYYLHNSFKESYDLNGKQVINGDKYIQYLEGLARAFMLRLYLTNERDNYHQIIYQTSDFSQISLKNDESDLYLDSPVIQIKRYLRYGSIRNIFVFNYLDYLLWKKGNGPKFIFTARSSIEHFYPQNKRDDKVFINDKNTEDTLLHSFGNLCLISHSLNSRVSNDMPDVKVKYFSDGRDIKTGNIDSLKLLKMIQRIKGKEDKWDQTMIKNHEDEMLEVLMQGLNLISEDAES